MSRIEMAPVGKRMTKASAARTPWATRTVGPRLMKVGLSSLKVLLLLQTLPVSLLVKPPGGKPPGGPWPQKPPVGKPPSGPPLEGGVSEVPEVPPVELCTQFWLLPVLDGLPLFVVEVPLLEEKGLTSLPPLASVLKLIDP